MPKQTEKPTQALVLSDVPKSLLARARRVAQRQDPPLDRNVWLEREIERRVAQEEKRLALDPIDEAVPA